MSKVSVRVQRVKLHALSDKNEGKKKKREGRMTRKG